MSESSIKTNHTTYNLQSWSKQKGLNPIAIEKTEGIYIWDTAGKRYTDMSSQLVNMNLGHGNKAIIDAIKKQAEACCYISPSYGSEPRGELAKLLVSLMPDNISKVFLPTQALTPTKTPSRWPACSPAAPRSFRATAATTAPHSARATSPANPAATPLNPASPAL